MNREILFRGKRIDNGEFAYGVPIKSNTGKTYIITYLDDSDGKPTRILWVEVDPTTVGEFTGLTDKNGTKIFEGDILKCKLWNGTWENYTIQFENGDFVALNKDKSNFISSDIWNEFEVIGSIHESEVE